MKECHKSENFSSPSRNNGGSSYDSYDDYSSDEEDEEFE